MKLRRTIAVLLLGVSSTAIAVELGDEESVVVASDVSPTTVVENAPERTADTRASRDTNMFSLGLSPTTAPAAATSTTSTSSTSTTNVARVATTAKKNPITTAAAPKKPAAHATRDGWMALIAKYDWDHQHAYRIMMCESGGRANAVNTSSGATGLFQIHPGGAKYLDPETNVAAAYAKYRASGWRPWVCK